MSSEDSVAATHTRVLYRRLLSYALPYKYFFIISILGFALFAGMEALLIRTIEFFINALDKTQQNSTSLSFIPDTLTSSILFVPIAIIVLSSLRGIGGFCGNYFIGKLGLNVVNTLRKQVFSHMVWLPQSYHDSKNSGELVSLIIYNIEQVTGSITNAAKILLRDGFSVISFLSLMFHYSWKLTLIFFATLPILAILIFIAGRYFRRVSKHIQHTVGRVTHIATQSLQGIKLVKSYNAEDYENKRFANATDENLKFATKFERVTALQPPVLHTVIAIASSITFLLILLFWEGTPAAAVAFVTATVAIAKPARQLSTVNAIIQRGMAAAETIFSTIDLNLEQDKGNQKLEGIQGNIELRNLSFAYNEENQVLKNINLTIPAGKTVALVGNSGSGKSTIANLLLRFYEPNSGDIVIDGTPITDVSLKELRDNISLVNQQTILFNDTIFANIAYGEDYQNIDKDRVYTAAKNAYANNFIEQFDQAYDTLVGEAGDRLSGGQRQRIAIARALYKNAPILILDEATSALDNESEKQIQIALNNLTAGRTTIVIAHRLSTIENADIIVVVNNGEIVEQGDHATLIAKNGAYAQLHQTQLN